MENRAMLRKWISAVAILFGLMGLAVPPARAAKPLPEYFFSTLDVPGSDLTLAWGINNSGAVVGYYVDANGVHGFLWTGGSYTTLDAPGAVSTKACGINDSGQIVGLYTVPLSPGTYTTHGFVWSDGNYTTLDAPGSSSTEAWGINNAGQIVGSYYPVLGSSYPDQQGYLLDGGKYTTLSPPGATAEINALKVNDSGQIVGRYAADYIIRGYVLSS